MSGRSVGACAIGWIGIWAGSLGLALGCASNGEPPSSQLRFIDSKMWEEDLQHALDE